VLLAGLIVLVYRTRRKALVAAALLSLVALGLLVSPANALLDSVDLTGIVQLSDDIVIGQVTSVSSRWTDERRRIVTDVTIHVDEAVKGRLNKDSRLHLQQPGGRVGLVVTVVKPSAAFEEGEEVVLFLERRKNHGPMVVAGPRGKYEVEVDSATGEKYVRASALSQALPTTGPAAPAKSGDVASDAADKPTDSLVPLEQFKQHLRDIVKKQRRR
jgi:hypothetical protein